jgi:hypothetical protein
VLTAGVKVGDDVGDSIFNQAQAKHVAASVEVVAASRDHFDGFWQSSSNRFHDTCQLAEGWAMWMEIERAGACEGCVCRWARLQPPP